jgi:hypothetical protein
MKYRLDNLSELALLLNFILAKAFLAKGLESKLKSPLSVFSKSLFIDEKKMNLILQKIEDAFIEIHNNQFVKYKFEVVISPKQKDMMIDISIINNDIIRIESIKKMLHENAHDLDRIGYEATLNF